MTKQPINLNDYRNGLAKHSVLKSQLIANGSKALVGRQLTKAEADELDGLIEMYVILDRAYRDGFTVNSRFARQKAFELAVCASEGFITTYSGTTNVYNNKWGLTNSGQSFKENLDAIIDKLIGAKSDDIIN